MIAYAPLRISFFGGNSDLPEFYLKENGAVLSATINKYAWVRVTTTNAPINHVTSSNMPDPITYHSYMGTAVRKLFKTPKRIYMSCEAPPKAGLGSSSAMIVALAYAAEPYIDNMFQLASLAQYIERTECKATIGLQDHFSAAYGGLNLIEFNKKHIYVKSHSHIPMLMDFQRHLLMVYIGPRKQSAGAKLASMQQRLTKGGDDEKITRENIRFGVRSAYRGIEYLYNNDYQNFGTLMHEAWLYKRALGTSNNYIDRLYELARDNGAYGGKICGAGGAGYMLLIAPPNTHNLLTHIYANEGLQTETVELTVHGAQLNYNVPL